MRTREGGGGKVCEGEQESEARISYAQESMMYEHEHEYNSSEKSKESTQSDSVLNEYYGKDRRKGQRLTPDTHLARGEAARVGGLPMRRQGAALESREEEAGTALAPPGLACSGGIQLLGFFLCDMRNSERVSQTGYLRRARGITRARN